MTRDSSVDANAQLFSMNSSTNLSALVSEGERALVVQVGHSDLLKRARMTGRTVRIATGSGTNATAARQMITDMLVKDLPDDVREKARSELAPCHLILAIGGTQV
jgi:hypothetical protein